MKKANFVPFAMDHRIILLVACSSATPTPAPKLKVGVMITPAVKTTSLLTSTP